MISVFLTRKPRLGEVKEEPQLVNARAGTQAQTGWLQCALMHLLCIKKLIYMSNAVRWLPTRLCVYYPLECQVLHWVRSFSLHHDQFFCAGGTGQGSIDEFSETAAICLNKAAFSIPEILARGPSSQPVPLEQAFLWCLRVSTLDPGKPGGSLTQGFSSLELINPQWTQKEDHKWKLCP